MRSATSEQTAAIHSSAQEVLLRAGAGSGKTTVLVDRYCDLILREQIKPEQILAFTFTRKAAAQLRERIRRALADKAAEAALPEDAIRLSDAASRVGSAWVMTIHSFCQAVIAGHPVAAGIDPAFQVVEGVAREKLRQAAFARALDQFLADAESRAVRERTVAAYGIENLRELTLSIHDELRSHGLDKPRLPEPRREAPGDLLDRLSQACEDLLGAEGYKPDRRNHEKILNLRELAANAESWLAGESPHSGPAALLAELEASLFGSSADGKREIAELAKSACRVLHEEISGAECYAHISTLLELYAGEFHRAKAERSGLDFDDLQLLAVSLLRDNEAVGNSYRERFRHIMVDEFQDTSPVQVALIEALKGPDTSVFQVGDKFQAIYAFRHADLANFDRVDRRLRNDPSAAVLPLSGNFRSSAGVLSVINGLTSELLPGFPPLRVGSDGQGRGPRGGGSAVEMILTSPSGWEQTESPPAAAEGVSLKRAAEAEALAHRLAELVDAGVPRSEIVVLLRTLSQAGVYATALDRLDLRPFVVGGRGFWQGREVVDAIALLRAIANPLDDEGILGALASPAAAVSPDTLWLLRRAAGEERIWRAVKALADPDESFELSPAARDWLDRIEARDREAIKELHSQLIYLRQRRENLGLTELVEEALTQAGLDLAAAAAPRGSIGLAALRKLSRLAAEYEVAEGRDLRGFLDYAQIQAARGDEAEAPTAAEGHDGVRIMTMHAAKGLEFPVVAVPELSRRFGGGMNTPTVRLSRQPKGDWLVGLELARLGAPTLKLFDCEGIQQLEKEEQASEELRLFYVAMTRAKERLILSGQATPKPKNGISSSTPIMPRLLDLLGIEFEKDGPAPELDSARFPAAEPRDGLEAEFQPSEISFLINWPESGKRLADSIDLPARSHKARRDRSGSEPTSGQLALSLEADAGVSAPIEALPEPPTPLPALSFTRLAGYERDRGDWRDENEPRTRRFESDEIGLDADGRAYGIAIHALLERSAMPAALGRRWRPVSDAAIRRELADNGLSDSLLPRARQQIEGWLASPLCQELNRPGITVQVETPLVMRLQEGNEATLRGWIDLLALPVSGTPLVIDYKSNRLEGREPEAVAADYELQAEIYALAVSRAIGVSEVEIAFVMLDRPDEPVRRLYGELELQAAELDLTERIEALRLNAGHRLSAPSALASETAPT